MWAEPHTLGEAYGHTPLSLHGPGCSGSLLGLSRTSRYPAVASLNLGSEALARWPFVPDGWRPHGAGDDDYAGPEPLSSATPPASTRFQDRFQRFNCPICPPPSSTAAAAAVAAELTPYHLVCECQHPALLAFRRQFLHALPSLIDAIVQGLEDARTSDALDLADQYDNPPDDPVRLSSSENTALQQLRRRAMPLALPSREQRFIAYWLLNGVTWPALAALRHQPSAAALGKHFDGTDVPHRWLRRIADFWLQWSEDHIRRLAYFWQLALSQEGARSPYADASASH